MRSHALLGLAGISAVLGTALALTRSPEPVVSHPQAETVAKTPAAPGHYVLLIEGNVSNLHVAKMFPKASGYNQVSTRSEFTVDLFDGNGGILGSYPLDLSQFETDAAKIGRGIRVQGCEVRDTNIAALINVPHFANTTRIQVRRGRIVLSEIGAAQIAQLAQQGATVMQGEIR